MPPTSLHIVGSKTLGGAELFLLRLVAALKDRGHGVTTMLRRGSGVVAAVPRGIPVWQLPMRTVWDPLSRYEVGRAIRAISPDIVQTYMGRATRLTHLRRWKGPVHVARLGGVYKLDGYRHAHAWIGNTRGVCDDLVRAGFPPERVFHIYNFIGLPTPASGQDLRSLRASLKIPTDAVVIAAAGRFVPVKGHRVLLEAFARLPKMRDGRPLWLMMIGDGPLRAGLQARAGELGVEDRICWTGWQNDPSPCFQTADLVAYPSRENETLGNVILDAWAHGKPLVTASFRGAREITRHGEDAWRVPCDDPAALAEGIAAVLSDETLARALAENGHARVVRDFSPDAIARRYCELYAHLLEKRT